MAISGSILTATGSLTLGAQLGWLGASMIGSMFAPTQKTQGPRLEDLTVTGTAYGQPIPWIQGTHRTAGQLIWSSDRREKATTTRQGKGGAKSRNTTYTYEVDCLFLLSCNELAGLLRVWDNGKLVYTVDYDATNASLIASSQTELWRRITFYGGDAAQLPDPTYEAAIGAGFAPAYRGMCTVFIEGLQLGQSGQFPNLTFEVGTNLTPQVVEDYQLTVLDELDLKREGANTAQLRRNWLASDLLYVPEVFWDYTATSVFTMERMRGIQVSQIDRLREAGIDIPSLARHGVEIFFTQVFTDGFFHADMHPGNIFVSDAPETLGQYIALDFGIVGSLSEFDKNYLAQNFLAFFQRDYRRVAQLHIESGWAPPDTREEELEGAVRAVCEPYFDRPLAEISLGQVLLRLFQTSRRFNVSIQPQLVLLQKTLLNVEGMGRELDPELDLWKTAKPYLERWMRERIGWPGLRRRLEQEMPQWGQMLPQLPRLVHARLARPDPSGPIQAELERLRKAQETGNRLFGGMIVVLALALGVALWALARG